jgi:hypothetical protein
MLLWPQNRSGRFDMEKKKTFVSVQTRRLRGNGNLVTEVVGFLAGCYSGIGLVDYDAL